MGKEYSNGKPVKKSGKGNGSPKNNKTILIAIAIALVVAIIIAVVVVSKIKGNNAGDVSGNPANSTADFNATAGRVDQPEIENGTVVIEYPSKDSAGNEVTVTKISEVNDFANQIRAGKTLDTLSQDKKDRFVARCADFGINEATAKEMIKDGTTWVQFSVDIYVANSEGKGAAMSMLTAKNTDSIYMDKQLGTEYGIPSGKGTYVTIEGIVDSSKYETEEDIAAALRGMDVKIIYTLMDNAADSVDDWSEVTTAYMPVKF